MKSRWPSGSIFFFLLFKIATCRMPNIRVQIALCAAFWAMFGLVECLYAGDFFLTIGGGYAPSGNQVSLERNVILFQKLLREKRLDDRPHRVLFADGSDPAADVQVIDSTAIPKVNQLMAEFFGSDRDLGLTYRNHQVQDVHAATTKTNIEQWFKSVGRTMASGDRLVVYVTSHGEESETRNRPFNTSISLWNYEKLRVNEFVGMLDGLPQGVSVVVVMVQCHAGGFSHFIYNDGDQEKGLSTQIRCGFFATLHDRSAAGCTPDIDEASYVEYSTYFWEAISGHTRLNQPIEPPDYDGNGVVSFDEAHGYTILQSDTIDLPINTSGEFLGIESGFQDRRNPDLLPRDLAYREVLKLATPTDHAVMEGLSEQLKLTGDDRLAGAERMKSELRPRGRSRMRGRPEDPASQLRRRITGEVKQRWPELANLLNPQSIALVTTQSDDFIRAIETHPDYQRYRDLSNNTAKELDSQEKLVKYERFIRAVENVIMRENLVRLGDTDKIAKYQSIVDAENASLSPRRRATSR